MDDFYNFFDDQRAPEPERTPIYHTPNPKKKSPNAALIISIVVAVFMSILVVVNVIVLATLKTSISKEYAELISEQMREEYGNAIADTLSDSGITEDIKDTVKNSVMESLTASIGEIANKYTGSVARICMYESSVSKSYGLASAFLITDADSANPMRYMVTNAHCVTYINQRSQLAEYGKIIAFFEGESKYFNCQIVAYGSYKQDGLDLFGNKQSDLAILRISNAEQPSNELHPSLRLAQTDFIQRGSEIALIGNPEGMGTNNSITTGTVSQTGVEDLKQDLSYGEFILTDAALNGGNSGGPMINKAGVVVGVSESKLVNTDIDNMGFAVSAGTLYNFLQWVCNPSYIGQTGHPKTQLNILDLCKFVYNN